MKKSLRLTLALALLVAVLAIAGCGSGLKSSNYKGFGPLKMRIPYLNYVNYFGYVSPSIQPDGKYQGKDAYYLYFWVPAVIDEVGVSMYSPADMEPKEGDFKHSMYTDLVQKNPDKFFDTYLALERMAIIDPAKIKNGGKALQLLTTNDDSSEMHKNPRGVKYNSLLRHKSVVSDPLKALVRGVYRITFTSFRGNVEGSYVASVGTNIPGVKIAASLEELHKLVNAN